MTETSKNPFENWPLIHSYSRAQAIADGVLVDLDADSYRVHGAPMREAFGIVYHVAMTCGAFGATVGAWRATVDKYGAGVWGPESPSADALAEASVRFMLSRVLAQLKLAITQSADGDRVHFKVKVSNAETCEDVHLWALCGPGDTAEPVITVMLEGED